MFIRSLTATYNNTTINFPEPSDWQEDPVVVEKEMTTESGYIKTNFMRDTYRRNIKVSLKVNGTMLANIKNISIHRSVTVTFKDETSTTVTLTARIRDLKIKQFEPKMRIVGGSSESLYEVSFTIKEF